MVTKESHPTGADYRVAFGAIVRRRRETRGWTQQQLADRLRATGSGLDLAQSGIARIELGNRPTSVEELLDLAEVFGLAVDELLPADRARSTIGLRLGDAKHARDQAREHAASWELEVRKEEAAIKVLRAAVRKHGADARMTRELERKVKAARHQIQDEEQS